MGGALNAEDIKRAAVIGCGMIGPDISASLLVHDVEVRLASRNESSVSRGLINIEKDLDDLVDASVIGVEQRTKALEMVEATTDIRTAVRDADVIFEAVYEDLAVKQEVFAEIDRNCRDRAILCSSTSGLSPNEIGARIRHQERMMVTHFWNPPYLVPLVEIVPHHRLSSEAQKLAAAFIERLGKVPVILKKDFPGHIGNRLQHALYREALYLIEQGVANPADIDRVVLASFGPRFSTIGPMEYFDSCGLDLHEKVQSYLYPTLCNAGEPQKILIDNVRAGRLGQKSGQGLYDWSVRDDEEFRRRRNERFIAMLKAQRGGEII
jgi:3-hydroxybutyryl-CoA dehydrogenase